MWAQNHRAYSQPSRSVSPYKTGKSALQRHWRMPGERSYVLNAQCKFSRLPARAMICYVGLLKIKRRHSREDGRVSVSPAPTGEANGKDSNIQCFLRTDAGSQCLRRFEGNTECLSPFHLLLRLAQDSLTLCRLLVSVCV